MLKKRRLLILHGIDCLYTLVVKWDILVCNVHDLYLDNVV